MTPAETTNLLNELLGLQVCSLASFLSQVSPWTHLGDEKATATLEHIVADQHAMAERIADLITELDGRIEPGVFRIEFADMHFLSLEFLLGELLRWQREDLRSIQRIAQQLSHSPRASELAQEALGSERAHLEALETLIHQPA